MAGSKVIGVLLGIGRALPVVVSGIKAVGMAFRVLSTATPLGAVLVILGLVAAALLAIEARTGGVTKFVTKLADGISGFFHAIFDPIQALFATVADGIEKIIKAKDKLLNDTRLGRFLKGVGSGVGVLDKDGKAPGEEGLADGVRGAGRGLVPNLGKGKTESDQGKDKDKGKPKGKSDFAPELPAKAPQFTGITEMFKRVQQGAIEDPQALLLKKQLEIAQQAVEEQKKTNKLLDKQPVGLAP
jgi:hypothetical protein